jgi:hypothetical protein
MKEETRMELWQRKSEHLYYKAFHDNKQIASKDRTFLSFHSVIPSLYNTCNLFIKDFVVPKGKLTGSYKYSSIYGSIVGNPQLITLRLLSTRQL